MFTCSCFFRGSYWGEMGFFRLKRGENQLGIEGNCAWATPKAFTEDNFPCYEGIS